MGGFLMANQVTNVSNSYESTLSSSLGAGDTTINVTSTDGTPGVPFFVVIDPADDSKREVVLVDSGKTGNTFTLSSAAQRGQDGTTDVAHDANATIGIYPIAAHWRDINDRVSQHAHSGGTDGAAVATASLSGHDKAAHDALGLDHGALSGLADDDHTQYLNEARHDVTGRHPISVLGDGSGLGLRQIVKYTAGGTFEKANYPYARLFYVKVQAGGGGGGGADATSSGQGATGAGGSGGEYAETLLTPAELGASEAVSVGSGGTGGPAGAAGAAGGNSSFGAHISTVGGNGGSAGPAVSSPGISAGGQSGGTGGTGGHFRVAGGASASALALASRGLRGVGGASFISPPDNVGGVVGTGASGLDATNPGTGGAGGVNTQSQGTQRAGGAGAPGIVIVEIYA